MSRGVLEPSYRKRIGYQAMLLGGMATMVSAVLVLGDLRTQEDIALRHAEDLRASLSQVMPASVHDNDLLSDMLVIENDDGESEKTLYLGRKQGKVSAVAFEVIGQGYSGDIASIMGVDKEGNVLGVRVLRHAETPGLGDKIEIARDNWITSFDGRKLADPDDKEWKVKKDGGIFDQFTGATITPRAVVGSVYNGLKFFQRHQQQILNTPQPEPAQSGEKTK